jgi:mono/diheme cytochrome c family protein
MRIAMPLTRTSMLIDGRFERLALLGSLTRLAMMALLTAMGAAAASAAAPDFDRVVKPILERHCQGCHNSKERKGEFDLASVATADKLAADAERVQMLLEVVGENFMPPKDSPQPLSPADRQQLVEWLRDRLEREARSQAGDPGRVVVRRLTNAELNYTLADLTGVARDWTSDFPRDGSGGEGFSNTGQTLQMSAGQIEKYLALAQRVAASAVVFPASGPAFAETPAPQPEWARLALERLDAFCGQYAVEYGDATPPEQLMSYAYPPGKAPKLDFTVNGLRGYKTYSNARPGDPLQFLLTSHRLFYRNERLCPSPLTFAVPQGELKQAQGRAASPSVLQQWERLWLDLRHTTGYARPFKISLLHRWLSFQPYREGDNPEFEERIRQWKGRPLDLKKDLSFTVMSLAKFLQEIRPTTPAELRDYANIQNSRDGESQGTMVPNHDAFDVFLHNSLTDGQLEALWRMACDPESLLAKRLEKVPPDSMRAEWQQLDQQEAIWRQKVMAAVRESLCEFAIRAWRRPLTDSETAGFQTRLEQALGEGLSLAEAVQASLVRLLVSPHFLYRIERGEQLAMKPTIAPSLAPATTTASAPTATAPTAPAPTASSKSTANTALGLRRLNDFELASRLSYFLWSSLPDEALLAAAQRGELSDPTNRIAHARRMLTDPRIRRFATEMFGQWLGFYRFDEFTRPDAERFAEFDADLRKAMYGEAIDFCSDLAANDRDVRLLLTADYAFLPSRKLAEHYGLAELGDPKSDAWTNFKPAAPVGVVTSPRVSLAATQRRGVLGWGAVLTSTSHPLRTSPVLRGNWILSDLLGIPTPPPPNAVPELPEDERNKDGLTVGQLLARHRENAACAVCHARIDPLGIALENFDPIGRFRGKDLNGTPINSSARLIDDRPIEGLPGLVAYMNEEKQQQLFVRRLCRKTLGYALGRSVLPGDLPLLAEIEEKLKASNGRFTTILEAIVTSPQFSYLKFEPVESRDTPATPVKREGQP